MKRKQIKRLKKGIEKIRSRNYRQLSRKDKKVLRQLTVLLEKQRHSSASWRSYFVRMLSRGLRLAVKFLMKSIDACLDSWFSYVTFEKMINTPKHLAYVLGTSCKEINKIISDIDKYYYRKDVPKTALGSFQKRNNKIRYRSVLPSIYPLKKIQKNISALLHKLPAPDFSYGSVKGRNNMSNAFIHVENDFFFSTDLKHFFTKINHHQVFKMFVGEGFSPTVARQLTQLTTYRGTLPQGAPSSPVIANLVFAKTGNLLLDFCNAHNITFTTFLDDLSFSAKQNFKHMLPDILAIVTSEGFHLHHKKISYTAGRAKITGIEISNHELKFPIEIIVKAKSNPALKGYLAALEKYKKQIATDAASTLNHGNANAT